MKQVFGAQALGLALAGSLFSQASAQWVSDPNLNTPVSIAADFQRAPAATSDGAGGIIVAWEDSRGTATDIYAQRLDGSGVAQWDDGGLPISTASGSQFSPMVVPAPDGGAVIAWIDERGGTRDLYAQRITASGDVLWDPDGRPFSILPVNAFSPKVIGDGGGGAIITWVEDRNGNDDIFTARFNGAGTRVWSPVGIQVCIEANFQAAPVLVGDGDFGAIFAWHDFRNGTDSNIFAQRIYAAGGPLWGVNGAPVAIFAENQEFAVITADGAGGAIIAWEDYRPGGTTDVFAQRMQNGNRLWGPSGVPVCESPNDQLYISLIPAAGGGAILTWDDRRSSSAPDIFAQRLDASGAQQWTPNGIALAQVNGNQRVPAIVADGADGAIVAWYDSRSNQSFDIFAQRVRATGQVAWMGNGVAISTPAGNQQFQVMVPTNGGGAIIAWEDGRSGTATDVYAQQVDADGTLGHPTVAIAPSPPVAAGLGLGVIHPHPLVGQAVVPYTLPSAGRVLLAIYDPLGRRVRTLIDQEQGAGIHAATIDAADLPAGLYVARLVQHGAVASRKILLSR